MPDALIPLEPVDSVSITCLIDNVSDMLLQNQGPAKRPSLGVAGLLSPDVWCNDRGQVRQSGV